MDNHTEPSAEEATRRSPSAVGWAVGTASVTTAIGLLLGLAVATGQIATASAASVVSVRSATGATLQDPLAGAIAVRSSTSMPAATGAIPATIASPPPTTVPGSVGAPTTTAAPAPALTPPAGAAVGSPVVANPWLPPSMPLPDAATAPVLSWGATGPLVATLQRRLAELGYRPGVDGSFDDPTWSAVLAFQKAENLPRTEEVDAATWARLAAPQAWKATPSNRFPRVEVDIERQIAKVVLGPAHVVTLNTSTGGGYSYRDENGYLQTAQTPIGLYEVYGKYDEVVVAPLGELYRPMYFEGGYAIHGSNYVPSYPDSHGCVRLAPADMDWLFDIGDVGMPVAVYETLNPQVLPGQPVVA